MTSRHTPFHPIIYVRGFAMTQGEIDDTTADPFCGFNIGSTVWRAVPDRKQQPRKFIFESPVLRLASDFGYSDVYEDGYDILDPEWETNRDHRLTSRSIIIHRYYDEASRLLGVGEAAPIETFASRLGELILRVRDLVCGNRENRIAAEDFRCYLVAHSMGGLVCRSFLQNPKCDEKNARRYVDKFFTYATPHNGIDVAGMNVPGWMGMGDADNFNRSRMAEYLDVREIFRKTQRVDALPERCFPAERVFCLVGTNRMDYEAMFGASRTFVGHGSDGLVKIENATLWGVKDQGEQGTPCAKAFVYRSHSGYFGIVNSEEAYQNLTRFLFGDVRVDVWMEFTDIRLPEKVQAAESAGKKVNALYQIETVASPRGKLWSLTRRTSEEDSAACVQHADWKASKKNGTRYLSTVFLANRARVNPRRASLAYSLTLNVRVPDYEIDRTLWVNEHYEGGYLFRDAVILELFPPQEADGAWTVRHAWQGRGVTAPDTKVDPAAMRDGRVIVYVPFESQTSEGKPTTPGVTGRLWFEVSAWNPDAQMTE